MSLQQSLKNSSLATEPLLLVIDAGTTNLKTFLFNHELEVVDKLSTQLTQYSPMEGWVEQDPMAILLAVTAHIRQLAKGRERQIAAIGLATQRESVTLWDPLSHEPLYPLISWQDRRTEDFCRDVNHTPAHRELVRNRTGLTIDAAFSASKIHWLMNAIATLGAQCGTLDSWLLYKLTKQHVHMTDRTNASRTMLFNIKTLSWDEELCDLFGIPEDMLPEVRPSFSDFGTLDPAIIGREIPILAVAGDQQASLYAVGAKPGVCKLTYGTGIFAMKTVADFVLRPALLTTLAITKTDDRLYALEGKVEQAAARVQPVLHDTEKLARVDAQLALETTAVLQTMLEPTDKTIIVDGGMSHDTQLLSKQESFLEGVELKRQRIPDGTALGMAKILQDRLFD